MGARSRPNASCGSSNPPTTMEDPAFHLDDPSTPARRAFGPTGSETLERNDLLSHLQCDVTKRPPRLRPRDKPHHEHSPSSVSAPSLACCRHYRHADAREHARPTATPRDHLQNARRLNSSAAPRASSRRTSRCASWRFCCVVDQHSVRALARPRTPRHHGTGAEHASQQQVWIDDRPVTPTTSAGPSWSARGPERSGSSSRRALLPGGSCRGSPRDNQAPSCQRPRGRPRPFSLDARFGRVGATLTRW